MNPVRPCSVLSHSRQLKQIKRIERRDLGVPREVGVIERKNPINAANNHEGGEPRVMCWLAHHAGLRNEILPPRVHAAGLGKQLEEPTRLRQFLMTLSG